MINRKLFVCDFSCDFVCFFLMKRIYVTNFGLKTYLFGRLFLNHHFHFQTLFCLEKCAPLFGFAQKVTEEANKCSCCQQHTVCCLLKGKYNTKRYTYILRYILHYFSRHSKCNRIRHKNAYHYYTGSIPITNTTDIIDGKNIPVPRNRRPALPGQLLP